MAGTEEQRAVAYRAQRRAQAAARAERCAALAGSVSARAALSDAWKPFVLAHLEAGQTEPDDDCLLPCPGLLGN